MRQIRQFIQTESLSGFFLLFSAVLALIIDNSSWRHGYEYFLHIPLQVGYGDFQLKMPMKEWINQAFMSIFFLVVGLEIKREILQGELNSLKKITLPAMAAVGGMIVPAIIYFLLNYHDPIASRGWAIPTATDIAFSLGILRLLHGRLPISLKIFLTALAIFDDIGAIIIIAFFYTTHIIWFYVALSLLCIIVLMLINYWKIQKLWPYLLGGIILWFFVLQSGIHAVLAGVALAFTIPANEKDSYRRSPLNQLEKILHPWVAFLILPLFGFANAGVSFIGTSFADLFNSVTWGVLLGLFIGKQLGVFLVTLCAIKMRWVPMLTQATWKEVYGVAIICGVGFTMSLFIGTLAFDSIDGHYTSAMRLGVLGGSLLSGFVGYVVLSSKSVK